MTKCPAKLRKVILFRMGSRFFAFSGRQKMQKSSSRKGRAFLHTKRDTACAARRITNCEGEQSEEENLVPDIPKNKKKKISHSAGPLALAVTIL